MRIKDTSLVYSYSISVCMGSFVFGYELTSFGNLNDLIVKANAWKDQQETEQTLLLLSSVLSLAAIFGNSALTQASASTASSFAPSAGSRPSKSPTTSPSWPHSSGSSTCQSARRPSPGSSSEW